MTQKLLKSAEKYCEENGLRFTETRRAVLSIIAGSKKPITSYEILDKLDKTVKNPKPPIVYRATDFLREHGFIHRIESLNAFVTCQEGHQHRGSQFMVCDSCGRAVEAHLCHLPDSIAAQLKKEKFDLQFWNIELHGRCKACRKS